MCGIEPDVQFDKRFIRLIVILFTCMFVCYSGYSKPIKVQTNETLLFQMEANGELVMITDEGYIEIHSHHQDSVKIEITKTAWAKTERRANWILKNLTVDVRRKGRRLIVREQYEGNDDFDIFDLFDPDKWHAGIRTDKNVHYRVTVPAGLRLRIKHDEGDVSAENLEASFSILIDEGDCQLNNIYSKDCRVEVDEGDILLRHFFGKKYSEIQLYCDEGTVKLDSITGHKAIVAVDEGRIIMEQIRLDMIECMIDEGYIFSELIPAHHGKYDFMTSEGDIEIRFLKKVPVRIAIHAEEGRINSNLDLKIRRSDEGEQVRMELGQSAGALLKVFTEEGDIQFYQNNDESKPGY
ncbi:DUF4097 family beta strand repeat protein [bacterium]|nr:DUF4097 family beta strand repeat protein [bacterium]